MESYDVAAELAKVKALAAEHGRVTGDLGKRSAERATAAVAEAERATARFSRLAERIRERAEERSQQQQTEELAEDDPVAELEALAEAIDEPDPDAPDEDEVEEFVDTMLPLVPVAEPEPDLPNTGANQWVSNERARPASKPDDDDFENPW